MIALETICPKLKGSVLGYSLTFSKLFPGEQFPCQINQFGGNWLLKIIKFFDNYF